MFRGLFRRRIGTHPPSTLRGAQGVAHAVPTATRHERPSSELSAASIFASAQKAPFKSLIVVLPANHTLALDRIAERMPTGAQGEVDVIVACASQPTHRAAIHAHLRNAQFLLAPAETSQGDLRVLAASQAVGDILTFVDGVSADVPPSSERDATPTSRMSAHGSPTLSVIIPVHDAGAMLDETCAAVEGSSLPRESYELIVVDDASTDGSATAAARYADTLIRLRGGSRGAAYARNRGAEMAQGDILVFVDAGVRVRRDTLERLGAAFDDDPLAMAIGASNDGSSGDGGVPTQYWNLLQQYGAQAQGEPTIHFNASCGAIRRDVFLGVGMFNEWLYRGATVEDLELGRRLQRAGHRVVLRHDVPVANARAHGIGGVLRRAWQRSSLLTRSLGYGRTRPMARTHLVHTLGSAKGVAAIVVAALVVLAAMVPSRELLAAAALGVIWVIYANLGVLRFFARRRGLTFALAATPLHLASQVAVATGRGTGWLLRNAIGDPAPDATTQAFAEVGVKMWPPVPRKL